MKRKWWIVVVGVVLLACVAYVGITAWQRYSARRDLVDELAEETAVVEAIPAAGLIEREQALLQRARDLMPRLLMERIDVLVVERFGKYQSVVSGEYHRH